MLSPVLKLDRNEYFFSHHPEILKIFKFFHEDNLSEYASNQQHSNLGKVLAESLNLQQDHKITFGHGAEDILIKSLSWLRLNYDTVVVEDFCWNNYIHIASSFNYQILKVKNLCIENRFYLDIEFLQKKLSVLSNSLVLLTSPNNPTGHSINLKNLLLLVQTFPNHIFLLDMVYAPLFSMNLSEFCKFKNVIVIGSFSKFFGLPGLRVGFALGELPNAFQLNLGMQKSSIKVCETALKNINWYQKNRNFMINYANEIAAEPRKNIIIYQSEAPFFLAKVLNSNFLSSKFKEAEFQSGVCPKYIIKDNDYYFRFGLGPESICLKIIKYLSFLY